MTHHTSKLRDFLRNDSGVAAVEFALIAPILIGAVLSMADIGLAIHERAEMDQALRNGAERAIYDPGVLEVEAVLAAVDESGAGRDDTVFSVNRFCACPESSGTATSCFTSCSNDRPTSIYYELRGSRNFKGFLFPAQTLQRTNNVQIR